jgi:hypothetical protein
MLNRHAPPRRIDQINIKVKVIILVLNHFKDLKVGQAKQFRDSLHLHRVSPFLMGSVGNKTLSE